MFLHMTMSPKTIEEVRLTRDQLGRLRDECFRALMDRATTRRATEVCGLIFGGFVSASTLTIRDRMKTVLLKEMQTDMAVDCVIDEIFESYEKTKNDNNKSTTSPSTTTTTTTPPIVLDNSKVDRVYSEFEIHCFWLNCRDLLRDTCISVDYHSTILESLKGIEMAQDSALRLRLENALSNPFLSGHEATHFADVVLLGDNPLHPTPIPFTNEKFTACNLIALRNACMKNMRTYGLSEIDLKIVADDQAFNYNQYGNLTYTNELRGRVYEVMLSLFSIGDLYRRERAMSFVDPLFGKDEHQPPSTTSATILSTSTTTTTTPVVTDDSTTDNKGSNQKKLYLVEMKELYLRCVDLLEELQTPEHNRTLILSWFRLPTHHVSIDRYAFHDTIRRRVEYNVSLQQNVYLEDVANRFVRELFLSIEQVDEMVSRPCSMPYISAIANIGLRYRCRKLMEEMNFPEQSITETLKRVFTYKVKDAILPSRKRVRDELFGQVVSIYFTSDQDFKKACHAMDTARALTEQLFGKDEEDEQTSSTTTPDRISTTDDKGSDQEKQLDVVEINELYLRCEDLLEEFQIPEMYRELVQNVFKVGGVPVNQSSIYSEMQSLFDQMPIDTSGFTADVTKFFLYELFVPIENADRDHVVQPYTEPKVRALSNAVLRYRCAQMMKEFGFSQHQINETLKSVFTFRMRDGQRPTRKQIRDELYVWLVSILPGHNLHNNVVRLTEQLFGKDEEECDQSSPTTTTATAAPAAITPASTNSTSYQEKLTNALSKDRLHELMDKCCAMLEELGTPREYRNLITATIDFVNPISERTLRAELEKCFSRLPTIDTSGFNEEQSYEFITNLIAEQQVKLPFTDKYFSALSMNALKLQCAELLQTVNGFGLGSGAASWIIDQYKYLSAGSMNALKLQSATKLQSVGDIVGLGSGDISWILDQSFIFQITKKGEYPTRKYVRDELMNELNKKLPIYADLWKRLESDLFGNDKDEKLEISLLQSHAQKPNYDWWNERSNVIGATGMKDVLQQSSPPTADDEGVNSQEVVTKMDEQQQAPPPPPPPQDQTPIETTTTPDEMLYDPLIAEKEFDELKYKCCDMLEADSHVIAFWMKSVVLDAFRKNEITLPILQSQLKTRLLDRITVRSELREIFTEAIREKFCSDLFEYQPITLPYNRTYISPLLFRAFRNECKSMFAPYGGGQYEIPTEYRDWIINKIFTFKMEDGHYPKRTTIRNSLRDLLINSLPAWCRFGKENTQKCMEKLFGDDTKECSIYSGHTERLYVPTPDEATSFERANKMMTAYLTQTTPHPPSSSDVAPFTTTKNGITSMFFGTANTSESTTSVQPINDQIAPPLPPIEIKKEEEQTPPIPSSDMLVRNGLRDTCTLYMNTREFKSCYIDLANNKLIIDFHPIKKRKL